MIKAPSRVNSTNNAQAAHDWATKRRLALEKAESIKQERKRGIIKPEHTFVPTINRKKSTKTIPMKQGFDPSYDDYYSGPATKAAPATAPHVDEGRMGSDEDDGSEGGAREGDTLSSELRKYNHVKSKPARQYSTPGASMVNIRPAANQSSTPSNADGRSRPTHPHPNNKGDDDAGAYVMQKNTNACTRNSTCRCHECDISNSFQSMLRGGGSELPVKKKMTEAEEFDALGAAYDRKGGKNQPLRRPEWNSDLVDDGRETESNNNSITRGGRRRNDNISVVTNPHQNSNANPLGSGKRRSQYDDREVGIIDERTASINFRQEYAEFNLTGSPSLHAHLDEITLSNPATPDASKLALLKEKMKVRGGRRSGSASRTADLKREFDDLESGDHSGLGGRRGARSAGLLRYHDSGVEDDAGAGERGQSRMNNRKSSRYLHSDNGDDYDQDDEEDIPYNTRHARNGDSATPSSAMGSKRVSSAKRTPSSNYQPDPSDMPFETPEDAGPIDLIQCRDCGRSFNEKAWKKHTAICQKVFMKKRKVFNMAEKRVEGLVEENGPDAKQIVMKAIKGGGGNKASSKGQSDRIITGTGKTKISKWKLQSLQLRQAMQQNRIIADAKAKGIPLSSLPPPAVSSLDIDDRTPCPNCGRAFNSKAAERHIPLCSSIKAKPKALMRGTGTVAGVKAKKR